MWLGDYDGSFYLQGPIASPCFDSEISSWKLDGLNDYFEARDWLDLFLKAQPDYIRDDSGKLHTLEYRFPMVKEIGYVRIEP
jgi:hypothetical protein